MGKMSIPICSSSHSPWCIGVYYGVRVIGIWVLSLVDFCFVPEFSPNQHISLPTLSLASCTSCLMWFFPIFFQFAILSVTVTDTGFSAISFGAKIQMVSID